MPELDPRVDAYIADAADFARPILERLRAAVHEGCPEVRETIKWGVPAFEHHGLLGTMAAFKRHCAFGFGQGLTDERIGKVASVRELPARKVLVGYVRQARRQNESGETKRQRAARSKPLPPVPPALQAALDANAAARATFDAFSPSHRREYIEWIADAKRDDTRERRVAQAVEWLAEGKPRNWKYVAR